MALEFNQLIDQVYKMGGMLHEILDADITSRLEIALERFYRAPALDVVNERIALARSPEVSGYRGAAPLDVRYAEPINAVYPCPPLPDYAAVIAGDGSQIYPDEQGAVHYYVINIGLFTYYHGVERKPDQRTVPRLYFHRDHVHDRSGRILSHRTIDARRTAQEMLWLARGAWDLRGAGVPVVALYDNHLLFWASPDVTGYKQVMAQYQGALVHMQDSGALLAGYVDNPVRSRMMIRLLHLLNLSEDEVRQTDLSNTQELEGVKDVQLYDAVLKAGERSALMVQNSPRNLEYKQQRGESYEIAFFYLKVDSGYQSAIARVDVPMWVARDAAKVNALHALLVSQAGMQGRNPYPYALTRADELAVVSKGDKAKLDELIRLELRKQNIEPRIFSAKTWGKQLARSDKRGYLK